MTLGETETLSCNIEGWDRDIPIPDVGLWENDTASLLLSTDDALDILCQMVFSREICFEWHLMSGALYLAWLLTQEDTLRLSPLKGCLGGGVDLGRPDSLPQLRQRWGRAHVPSSPASAEGCPTGLPGTWLFPAEP